MSYKSLTYTNTEKSMLFHKQYSANKKLVRKIAL